MSITVLIGAAFAIVIGYILFQLLLKALARAGYADSLLVYALWAAFIIICIFLIAWAFEIPIPFFRWR